MADLKRNKNDDEEELKLTCKSFTIISRRCSIWDVYHRRGYNYNALLSSESCLYDLNTINYERLGLYTKGVFIMDKCKDLIPDYPRLSVWSQRFVFKHQPGNAAAE